MSEYKTSTLEAKGHDKLGILHVSGTELVLYQ